MDEMAFGRYQLLSLIGEGGMGKVYKAHDTVIGRDVAIKVLPPELSAEPGYRERFRREAHTAARLTEPHIIPIYDTGEFEGRLYLVMPVIDGIDVQALLKRDGPMSPQRAVHVTEQLAAALHAAHAVGLVHRDVKPSNALLTGRDFIYLIDFGIAHDSAATKLTRTGMIVGSWAYMAPERFTTGAVESSADVYALTCVLYECLTGVQPYPGDSLEQQIAGHITLDPPTPSSLNPAIPTGFGQVIACGMAKNPRLRYPSANDLAIAARDALTSDPARVLHATAPLDPTQAAPAPSRLHSAPGPTLLDPTQPPPGPTVRHQLASRPPADAAGRQAAGLHVAVTQQRPSGPLPPSRSEPAARPASPVDTPPAPPRRRRRLMWALIAATVVVLVGGGVGGYLLRAPQTPSVQPMPSSGPNNQPEASPGPASQPVPASGSTVLSLTGLNDPAGVAADGAGNVYVADSGNNRVLELATGSGSPTTLPFTGLGKPSGIALDARGAVYVTNAANNQVLELAAGSSATTEVAFPGLNGPRGVAVDAAGDLYVADSSNRVLKLAAGSNSPTVPPFTGLTNPTGVAVDTTGAVYVTDSGNNRVLRLPTGADAATPLPFIGLNNPDGVAVDPAGNLYVVDRGNNRVLKLAAGSSTPTVLQYPGLSGPTGAAVDIAGNLYITDTGNNRVVKLAAS